MRSSELLLGLIAIFALLSCFTDSDPVYTLSTSSSPAEAGELTPASSQVSEGESIQITVNPNEHWVFNRWGGDLSGKLNPASVLVSLVQVHTGGAKQVFQGLLSRILLQNPDSV